MVAGEVVIIPLSDLDTVVAEALCNVVPSVSTGDWGLATFIRSVAWSPDSGTLLFGHSDEDGSAVPVDATGLCSVSASGGPYTCLVTLDRIGPYHISVAPSGRVAFDHVSSYVMNLDGTGLQAPWGENRYTPIWRP